MISMRFFAAVPSLLCLMAASSFAAESISGIVEQVKEADGGAQIMLRFDAQSAALLLPGEMVALYAPGTVEKHPLTGQVIVSRPVLAAKAQLTQVVGLVAGQVAGVVRWTVTGAKLTTGMDAIPLPKEAAPNAPPALTAAEPRLSATQGSAVNVQLPVADWDKDPLVTAWRLEGPAGRSGRLLARNTGGTTATWIAPALPIQETTKEPTKDPSDITIIGSVRDPLGQEVIVRVSVTTTAANDLAKRGALKPLARWGLGVESAVTHLTRDAAGTWWGLAADSGTPLKINTGWLISEPLALPQDQLPKRAAALAVRGDELHVLDSGKRTVVVYGTDSTVRRTYGTFDSPTDLAIGPDGTAFIADQGAGGVEIIEPDGSYRGRLGHAGTGQDAFQQIVAVAVDRAGDLYALDAGQRIVIHYDRFQRRVNTWAVPGEPKDLPVDLAIHPQRGVMVLHASGHLVAVSSKGAVDVTAPLLDVGIDPGPARSLAIDQLGEIITCHPDHAAFVRFSADLKCTGIRSERMRGQSLWAADGAGRSYGLDQDSGLVTIYDPEGWAVGRVDAEAKGGGMFGSTLGLAVDLNGSRLWVSDSKKHGAHRIELEKTANAGFVGGQGENNGQFQEAVAISTDDAGRVYVLDAEQYRVQVFAADGAFLFAFGQRGKGLAEFNDPTLVAVAPGGEACFVYDAWSNQVKKFTLDQTAKTATHVTNGGGKGSDPGQLRKVIGIACDRLGLLYALDSSREDLQVFDFRSNSCVTLFAMKFSDAGVPKASALAVAPDGQVGVIGNSKVVWLRW